MLATVAGQVARASSIVTTASSPVPRPRRRDPPHCLTRTPIGRYDCRPLPARRKKKWPWIVAALVLVFVIAGLFGDEDGSPQEVATLPRRPDRPGLGHGSRPPPGQGFTVTTESVDGRMVIIESNWNVVSAPCATGTTCCCASPSPRPCPPRRSWPRSRATRRRGHPRTRRDTADESRPRTGPRSCSSLRRLLRELHGSPSRGRRTPVHRPARLPPRAGPRQGRRRLRMTELLVSQAR